MTDEPARQVTFLLSDIEGSTRLLRWVGPRYPAMVERHRAILGAAAERHGGRLTPVEGDGCLAIFDAPEKAVAAAVDAQRDMHRQDWGPTPLRVRVGVHSGQAVLHHGEHFGLDLHRAARITDAGHGGQVLVSGATCDRLAHLPEGIALRDLGHHRLRDLEGSVHLFQVVAEGLDDEHPPLRTLSPDVHNLPAETVTLVGRDREIVLVHRLLEEHRLVTLTGPGGVGKTRLAIHVGASTASRYDDGVRFVELTRVTDPTAVSALIASTLGISTSGGSAPGAVLAEALRDRSMLLILDNFEHVVDAAPDVGDLLAAAPGIRALVTSRERLLIAGEVIADVPALDARDSADEAAASDAVTLFVDRARAQDPTFSPDADELRDITAICRLVDGLPLAIELVAAQTRVLPVRTIRARLRSGLDAVTSERRDGPARHRSLRDTVAWSHRLLSPEQQRLFAWLAVFRGGRTLEAVTAVCGDVVVRDPVAGVTALVDKSLLHRRTGDEGVVTFDMLELIHDFAGEALLASGEHDTASERHARWMVDLAERSDRGMFGPQARLWEDRLRAQLENLRRALRWSFDRGDPRLGIRITAALNLFWYWGGPHEDGRDWIVRSLGHPELVDDPARARLAVAAGFFAYADGDMATARDRWEAAVDAFALAGEDERRAWAHGMIELSHSGDPTQLQGALARVEDALADLTAMDASARSIADMRNVQGELARLIGDDVLARRSYQEALTILRDIGDTDNAPRLQANLAFIATHDGDHDTALALVHDALAGAWKLGKRVLVAQLLGEAATPETHLGRPERAAQLIGASDAALARFGAARQPTDEVEHEATVQRLTALLGTDRLDELRADGARLSLDDAVDLALSSGARSHG